MFIRIIQRTQRFFTCLVVIYLQRGVDPSPDELDHVVLTIIDTDTGVLHHNVLLSQIVHCHQVSINLQHI